MFMNMNKYLTPETFLQQLASNSNAPPQTVWHLLGGYGTQRVDKWVRISGLDRGDRKVALQRLNRTPDKFVSNLLFGAVGPA